MKFISLLLSLHMYFHIFLFLVSSPSDFYSNICTLFVEADFFLPEVKDTIFYEEKSAILEEDQHVKFYSWMM